MEELQSTEALDREILEDARKKAFKILKTADESVASSKAAWDRKLAKTLDEAGKSYRQREEQGKKEIMARLPMDKRRIRSEKIEAFLDKAMGDFLSSLTREEILSILEQELRRRLLDAGSAAGSVAEPLNETSHLRYRGLSPDELEGLLKKTVAFAPLSQKDDPLYLIEPLEQGRAFPALVLDFPSLRITASVDKAAAELLLDKRSELAAALLGEDAVNEDPL
jgi:hypothetical protein